MMHASTAEMPYEVDEQPGFVGEVMTPQPRDILFTGSPSGSASVHGDYWARGGAMIRPEIASVGVLDVSVREDR